MIALEIVESTAEQIVCVAPDQTRYVISRSQLPQSIAAPSSEGCPRCYSPAICVFLDACACSECNHRWMP
jgi:hypothetical protein